MVFKALIRAAKPSIPGLFVPKSERSYALTTFASGFL